MSNNEFFFGVMSKNVVDTVICYAERHPSERFIFIPSRRQIDYCKGYTMNWTTSEFVEYVRSRNGCGNIFFERDHGGPGQGAMDDDGFESLKCDAELFDFIHIDPWKKYPSLEEGLNWSVEMIRFCYAINPSLKYEISTEEAIRPFTVEEIEEVILGLKSRLEEKMFLQIQFLVVQCGTLLLEGKNIGRFDSKRLSDMLNLAGKYGLTAKEHNGDWVDLEIFKRKKELGLSCFNIAPELAYIETSVLLESLKTHEDDYLEVYRLCLESEKWKKWIGDGFDWTDKDKLILITCHYLYSSDEFQRIVGKPEYQGICEKIGAKIYQKITDLYSCFDLDVEGEGAMELLGSTQGDGGVGCHYSIRNECIFCSGKDFEVLFEKDYSSSLSLGLYDSSEKVDGLFMPYNVLICSRCHTAQNQYLGDLSIVYHKNHIDNYGSTKQRKYLLFSDFICQNKNIQGIVEVGACHDTLATHILKSFGGEVGYTIIEPSFTSSVESKIQVVPDYIENVDLRGIHANTIIMSDVFEHFYKPLEILKRIYEDSTIQYIYLNHPDFDYSIHNNILINLNCEHTFLIEHSFLFSVFEKHGFRLSRRFDFEHFSLFLEFERISSPMMGLEVIRNENTRFDVGNYFDKLVRIVSNMNVFMKQHPGGRFYLWPTSVHSITLLTLGLDYKRLTGILDNSPNKIGKYLYGYDLLCLSFDETLKTMGENDFVFLGGAGNYIQELVVSKKNILTLESFL